MGVSTIFRDMNQKMGLLYLTTRLIIIFQLNMKIVNQILLLIDLQVKQMA